MSTKKFAAVCLVLLMCFSKHSFAQLVPKVSCSQSQCGCWESKLLSYRNVIVAKDTGDPVRGITVSFRNEEASIAVSDSLGIIKFEMPAKFSPGCGYGAKNHLVFSDSTSVYVQIERTVFQADTIKVERSIEPRP